MTEEKTKTDEHRTAPSHRRTDRDDADYRSSRSSIENIRDDPLTIKKLAILMSLFLAANQAINVYNASRVDPAKFQQHDTELRGELRNLRRDVSSLDSTLRAQAEGNWFFYYGICVQFKRQNSRSYPRFCDRQEITRFDPDR